jgi:hypothetical protein
MMAARVRRTAVADPERNSIDLDQVRADGWLEQLGEDIPEFEQLCTVVGRRFVGFSFITSVRIVSIAYDPHAPHTSLVDFTVGDDEDTERLTLADFRERLGSALLSADEPHPDLPDAPDVEDVRQFIGRRYLLLCALFGVQLLSIEREVGAEPILRIDLGGLEESISVAGLRDVLHNAIRSELSRARPNQPFSIDFKKIPLAEAANERGAYYEAIALLGAWPGPLSMFLRTPQGQALGPAERSKLVRALGALGEAYLRTEQGDWAEDVLRLGIQFGQELPASGALFRHLGRARIESGRYGEAIGLFRRALSLGADRAQVLPELARCFIERGKLVAAAACLDEARTLGARDGLEQLEQRVLTGLGPALTRVRDLLSGSSSDDQGGP